MLVKFIGLISVLAAIILLFFLVSTTPISTGPVGILVVFICLYIIGLGMTTLLLWSGHRLGARLLRSVVAKRPIERLSVARAYYFSSIIALGPVMLLAMQSVGVVQIYEVGLVTLFVVIGCVYIAKRTA